MSVCLILEEGLLNCDTFNGAHQKFKVCLILMKLETQLYKYNIFKLDLWCILDIELSLGYCHNPGQPKTKSPGEVL